MKVALIGEFHQVGINILNKKKIQCDQINDNSSDGNLIENLKDADAIGVRTAKLPRKVLENCSKLKTSWLECLPYPRCDHCGHHFIRPKADIPVRKPSLLTLVFTVLRVAPVKNLIKGGNSSSGSVATS